MAKIDVLYFFDFLGSANNDNDNDNDKDLSGYI